MAISCLRRLTVEAVKQQQAEIRRFKSEVRVLRSKKEETLAGYRVAAGLCHEEWVPTGAW